MSEMSVSRKVVVGRTKEQINVTHRIVHEDGGIRVEQDLDEFLEHLSQELGPSVLNTRAGLLKRLKTAADAVLRHLHDASAFKPLPKP